MAACGGLPLAVGMVAARLRRPHRTARELLARLEEAGSRLGELRDHGRTVAAAFDMSYDDLTGEQQRLFRLLGARPGTETDPAAAAALLAVDPTTARHLLEDLEDYRLVDELTLAAGRYRMHDLVREHAAAAAAVDRLLAYYRDTGSPRRRNGGAAPSGHDRERALAWVRTERANLLACRRYAAQRGQDAFRVGLSAALAAVLRTDGPWSEALDIHADAAEAAGRLGDSRGQAGALADLGAVRRLTGDYPGAADALGRALRLSEGVRDPAGQAGALLRLAAVRRLTGDYQDAAEALDRAGNLFRGLGDALGEADTLREAGRTPGPVRRLPAGHRNVGSCPAALEPNEWPPGWPRCPWRLVAQVPVEGS